MSAYNFEILQNLRLTSTTLGCKLNFAETSAIAYMLLQKGCVRTAKGEIANICLVNTCSVTDTADKKCRQAIHKIIKENPEAVVVVTGCYAQLKPQEVNAIEGVDVVLGANDKFALERIVEALATKQNIVCHTETKDIRNFYPICSADDRTRHFLKVQDGCDYYCTYCTIPFARGRSRNASVAETVAAAQRCLNEGAREIVLTGVNTGDFGRSTDENFLSLVEALDKLDGEYRYRISSVEPNLLSDEIISFVANSHHFAPHFHIPLQSGSDEVLKLMRRHYDTELFASRVARIKQLMPNAFIGVDVMAGTRGETEERFQQSLAFIEALDVSQLHVFTYSERANTKALEIQPIVPQSVRKQRTKQLQTLSEEKLQTFYQQQIGKEHVVLWESSRRHGMMYGFAENYLRLTTEYDAQKVNRFECVMVTADNTKPEL